jgi:hypothetical protein
MESYQGELLIVHELMSRENFSDLSVKFVPRLGPLAVARLSKNATASACSKNVADTRPPYLPVEVRH